MLARRPVTSEWTFTLDLAGLDARARADGSIALVPEGGEEPLFVLPKPFMVDAVDDPASPYGKRHSDKVTQALVQRGGELQLTVRADAGWLDDPARRYPVKVDPTIRIQPVTWAQSLDVAIWQQAPTTNFDSSWQLPVGTSATGSFRSLVKFPLSDIPSGTQIDSAQLMAYFDGSHSVTPSNSVAIEARRVTAAWSDTTATWNTINTAFAEAGLSTATRGINQSGVWHSFNVRNIVQSWLNGTPNHGFMLKAVTETLNQGGPIYEAAPGLASYNYDYGGETQNGPKLIVSYGRPSVTLNPPTRITATGAQLSWTAYADPSTSPNDDLIEYQVHRRPNGNSSLTPMCGPVSWSWCRYPSRIAVLPPGTTSYQDTSAPPTPVDDPDPEGDAYDYWIVVKTRDGQVSASQAQVAYLPKAGRTKVIVQAGTTDTTLSKSQPTANLDVLDGRAWLSVGNNSSTYGVTRALAKFPTTAVPAGATVLDAELSLWGGVGSFGTGATTYNVHKLTRSFNETVASWNLAGVGTPWSTTGGGGDFDSTVLANQSGFSPTADEPQWRNWKGANLNATVQGWVNTPSSNFGFLLKTASEATTTQRTLFMSSEAAEPAFRPRLTVTYTERIPENTYHVPTTPERMTVGDTTTVPVTVTNTTTQTLWAAGSCPLDQYKASYFANTTLSGTPAGERCEGAIDNSWGSGGPTGVGVGVDGFSVRWVKVQGFAAGTYTFSATADDGVRVYLDGVPLIDQWKDQAPTTYTVSRSVSAGDHELKVEYYEGTGGATARFNVTAGGACPIGQYQASYFANTTLSGTPTGQRCEGAIDNDWAPVAGRPGSGSGPTTSRCAGSRPSGSAPAPTPSPRPPTTACGCSWTGWR